jgi:hypothetical protein
MSLSVISSLIWVRHVGQSLMQPHLLKEVVVGTTALKADEIEGMR